MATLEIGEFEDSFVIHLGGAFRRINAYTLATTLINIADAAKVTNAEINPGYEIEVVVEALGSGSFKAKIRTLYKKAGNLFSGEKLNAIVCSVIAAFIYEHAFSPGPGVVVNVTKQEVVIQQGDTRIVVPREVHDAMERVEKNDRFRSAVGGMIPPAAGGFCGELT
ncbi:MAG: hypothetical protein GY854_30525 [Deltaproteobacteria bacterium]|nr:hypothetical protein [Deltaproteobacteria bacterium]